MVVDTRHFTFCPDEKYLAIFSSRLRVISWETGKEVLKCPNDMVSVTTYSGYKYLSLQTQSIMIFYFYALTGKYTSCFHIQ